MQTRSITRSITLSASDWNIAREFAKGNAVLTEMLDRMESEAETEAALETLQMPEVVYGCMDVPVTPALYLHLSMHYGLQHEAEFIHLSIHDLESFVPEDAALAEEQAGVVSLLRAYDVKCCNVC